MACQEWNDDWIAHLYDELPPEEERRLRDHLAACGECRRTLEELSESRSLLREACPAVPANPSVMVLRPRRWFQPLWACAAGAACATLIFAAGFYTARGLPGSAATGPAIASVEPARPTGGTSPAVVRETHEAAGPADDGELAAQLEAVRARLDALERDVSTAGPPASESTLLTRAEFEQEMTRRDRRLDLKRSQDYQFLLEQMAAYEWRTGTRLNQTREAINWVAMRSDPRLSER